ncbi:LytTR family DNA-binding domain-containing protein [Terrimonas sp. NA20]|uniref:LytTR family DNA-binding domain-containing protein n=1 Tax=Terrimonas ginsenosidimutans TaxID=2908004 RepID=A0ABS9KKI6_9BACT|nr:LytTR family DNA-binding domain-containing protein [Terrimonas ginsenosidimutans]MCG2612835.1 LytTR family DNA-binding domain-containing protein [Terrimonas ginsenosidimutans]
MICLIIDDEPLARQEMQAMISIIPEIHIAGTFSNAPAAMDFLQNNKVDLIFLDIEMPLVSGLEFAAQIPKEILTIFTTAYSQYAAKSYELDAIDYLLKPIGKDRLEKAIRKAKLYKSMLSNDTEKNQVEGTTDNFLLIKADRKFHRVNFEDILYIEGLKDYVVIYTKRQKLITAMNLRTIHQRIPHQLFLRVSKSYLVNQSHIDSFDHHTIYIGDTEIPLGEVYKKEFFQVYSAGSVNPDNV